ncbi:hypothetical protein [Brevundimonas sp. Root1279]|uniref:hypothetical protein n=1 Tax=Brevundimonas sp. Root1279 TaxID=1736443 RepID=UPI0006F6F9E2|nr:hypothetical protein [Brevundimonas sp. Root1279]KQW86356.1 hypothetical protein ASC65_00125 [Brevundimonas sp. Root1279]
MSGYIVAILAGVLVQQAAPHPSTLETYSAPAIRPFEPASDFGQEVAQGDAAPNPNREPLAEPVRVDAYARSYEYAPTDAETAYDQGVASAEVRTDQTAGPLDGAWRIADGEGRTLYEVVLLDAGGAIAEGGWRRTSAEGGATASAGTLTLEGVGTITLTPSGKGWTGRLTADGRTTAVTLTRPD